MDDLASELVSSKTAINERQVLWFIFHGDAVATNYTESLSKKHRLSMVKRYFQKSEKRTQVLLIGKDGGVKSEADAINLNKLFALIDIMPMRQVEMRDTN